jgi:hypothetical protein
MYSKRLWLNDTDSPSTGSVVAYRGNMVFGDETKMTAFLEISDCHNKARLHVSPMDTMQEYIIKMERLRDFISDYIDYLKKEKQP